MVNDTSITFRCSEDLKEQLEYLADINGMKISKLIRDLLEDYVKEEGNYNG